MRIASTILTLLCCAGLHGCTAEAQGAGDHEFTPQHGGQPLELAAHGPILEVVHDAKAGRLRIFAFGPHQEVLELGQAPTCTIGAAQPILGKGAGTAWEFIDARLQGHPHDVMLAVEIDGEQYSRGWHPPH